MSISGESGLPFSLNATKISTSAYTYSDWLDAKAENVSVLYRIAPLNATSVMFTVQGRLNSSSYESIASLYTEEVTASMSVHSIYNVTSRINQVRVGAKLGDYVATPNVLYAGLIYAENK